ncbi:MAG TPA: glycosyltransferase, partial [Opitutus sp.]|nr:glycosyltransferase [Opitutus sp.]
ERAGELQRRFPAAKIVAEPDAARGMYAAINAGAAAAREWEAITWINDDDELAPGFAAAVAALGKRGESGIVYGRVELIDADGARVGELPVARRPGDLAALLARGIVPLAQPGTLIRRDAWERLGGVDATYRLAGDLDFWVRAVRAGVKFEFVNKIVARFRLAAGQLSKRRDDMAAETRRALAPLAGATRAAGALWRFRVGNIGAYLERLRRHGWVSMRELHDRTGNE